MVCLKLQARCAFDAPGDCPPRCNQRWRRGPELRREPIRSLPGFASRLSTRRTPSPGKVYFNVGVGYWGTRAVESLLDATKKPEIVRGRVGAQREGKRAFVRSPGEQDADRIRDSEAHGFEDLSSTCFDLGIDTGLYKSVLGHSSPHPRL